MKLAPSTRKCATGEVNAVMLIGSAKEICRPC